MKQSDRQNTNYRRAVACLAHPFSLIALFLLLLNDHLFRVFWPGMLTGKLGDFAWLFFTPFVLAALFSKLLPCSLANWKDLTFIAAASLVGVVFSLVKISPDFHSLTIRFATGLFGWPVGWRQDPTDLVALIALLVAYWLWQRVTWMTSSRPVRTGLLVSLAAFLTLANSIQPETGIVCLDILDENLHAFSSRNAYLSTSGGLDWKEEGLSVVYEAQSNCDPFRYFSSPSGEEPPGISLWPEPGNPEVVYRTTRGESVERSTDGGQTWVLEFKLQPDSQSLRAYHVWRYSGNARVFDGPLDAVFDPVSGNLVLAMGHDGVLVRKPEGTYTWVNVGSHQHSRPSFSHLFFSLLPGEMLMAFILGGLGVMFISLRREPSTVRGAITILLGLIWLGVAVFFPPSLQTGPYLQTFVYLALGGTALVLLFLLVFTWLKTSPASRQRLTRFLFALLVGGMLFLLPFIAWLPGLLPNYRLAQVFGFILGCVWIFDQSRRR